MLVITLGDPWSITQQCLLRLRALWAEPQPGPVVCVGSYRQWQLQTQRFAGPLLPWQRIDDWSAVGARGLYFLAIDGDEAELDAAQLSPLDRGRIATRSLECLRQAPTQASSLAVLTAPIDKKACSLAGFHFPGQTEFFEDLWRTQGIMILAGARLRVALVTNHLALQDVAAAINTPLILHKLQSLDHSLRTLFQLKAPRIGVAALNPHAGDGGLFGQQEPLIIKPAIEQARGCGIDASGPFPADTVFFRAYEGEFDAVLAMYHDQGLGPLKTVHFYDAVNITGGLPALRISPDHGPAANLYGRSEAREDSFHLALQHARRYLGW